jgi:ribosomal protein L37AE/L43A
MSQHTDERKKNSMMNDNFNDVIIESMKNSQHKCNHCEHQSIKNAAKKQLHLKTCDAFIKKKEKKKQEFFSKIFTQLFITFFIRFLNQAQIA